jgi:hypothetical protein
MQYSKKKKHDIISLLGQMCPPAASSATFGKLGPIVPLSAWQVVGMCNLPGTMVGGTHLVVVDSAAGLDWGCGAVHGESSWHWRWHRQLWGKGALCSFSSLVGKGVLAAAVVMVTFRHMGVVDRAVVPKIGVPLWQDAVGVVAVDVWGQTLATPMAHS